MDLSDLFSHIIWRPGIEDNTLRGWLIVALYYGVGLLAIRCWLNQRHRVQHARRISPDREDAIAPDRWFYWLTALLLIGLGAANQWGILRWLTSLGRSLAWEQGWYNYRTLTQLQIIQSMYLGTMLLFLLLVWINRRRLIQRVPVLLSVVFLLGFLSVRAVSLHAVDALLYYRRVAGIRLGTMLEIGTLILIALALLLPHLLEQATIVGSGKRLMGRSPNSHDYINCLCKHHE